jgi:hypothetical protein
MEDTNNNMKIYENLTNSNKLEKYYGKLKELGNRVALLEASLLRNMSTSKSSSIDNSENFHDPHKIMGGGPKGRREDPPSTTTMKRRFIV